MDKRVTAAVWLVAKWVGYVVMCMYMYIAGQAQWEAARNLALFVGGVLLVLCVGHDFSQYWDHVWAPARERMRQVRDLKRHRRRLKLATYYLKGQLLCLRTLGRLCAIASFCFSKLGGRSGGETSDSAHG